VEIANIKDAQSETTTGDLPALAAKDELRNLGYLPDDQNLLFGNAAPIVSSTFDQLIAFSLH